MINADFGKALDKYIKYRPAYPEALFREIMDMVDKPYKRAVDLGAGTGLSSFILKRYFEEVYAVEPDKKMTGEIAKTDKNIKVFKCSAEEYDTTEKSIDTVTSGNSFYWMDGEKVIKKIYSWLRTNGVFAAYRYNFPTTIEDVQDIIDMEMKKWDEYRNERLRDTEYTYRIVNSFGMFKRVEKRTVENIINLSAEELLGFFTSTSYMSEYIRNIQNPISYVNSIYNNILSISKENKLPVNFNLELIIAVK